LFDLSKLSFIESATAGAKSVKKIGWTFARGENRMGPVTWATIHFIQHPWKVECTTKVRTHSLPAGIIELTIEIGVYRAGENLTGSARAL